nr:hypothetical protein Iba_chr01cCG10350 [Ipomoea batatas]
MSVVLRLSASVSCLPLPAVLLFSRAPSSFSLLTQKRKTETATPLQVAASHRRAADACCGGGAGGRGGVRLTSRAGCSVSLRSGEVGCVKIQSVFRGFGLRDPGCLRSGIWIKDCKAKKRCETLRGLVKLQAHAGCLPDTCETELNSIFCLFRRGMMNAGVQYRARRLSASLRNHRSTRRDDALRSWEIDTDQAGDQCPGRMNSAAFPGTSQTGSFVGRRVEVSRRPKALPGERSGEEPYAGITFFRGNHTQTFRAQARKRHRSPWRTQRSRERYKQRPAAGRRKGFARGGIYMASRLAPARVRRMPAVLVPGSNAPCFLMIHCT